MKKISLLTLALGLTLTACRDQPTQPVLPGPSRTAVVGGSTLPAPVVYYTLASGNLMLLWQWGDDQPWDLVSFDLTVDRKPIKGDWTLKPYAAQDGGFYPTASFTWRDGGFGQTVPNVCVSVMAKSQPEKGSPTTTYHAQNCNPLPMPSVRDGPPLQPQTITAGAQFSCGLTYTGEAYCWGYNGYGQLGDGTTTNRSSAGPVSGGLTFRQISAGGWELWQSGSVSYPGHACALTASGVAYCWGNNSYGQLGDGTTADHHAPTIVSGGHSFTQISAGAGSTCAVATTGDAYCWGLNSYGEVGDGTTTNRPVPQLVSGGLKFAQISTGGSAVLNLLSHTCGVTTTGLGYCWGANSSGEIGNGGYPNYPATAVTSPVGVAGGLAFQQISAGGRHTCGVTTSGAAYCWGFGLEGQVGNGVYSAPVTSPSAVAGNLTFSKISAGASHTCGYTSAGLAYCWGYNNTGQLGAPAGNETAYPAAVYPAFSGTQLSSGFGHTCAVTVNGVAYCWGDDRFGEIGNGQAGPGGVAGIPVRVQANPAFQQLSAGYHHACGLTATGEVYCWGDNAVGQLGDGTTTQRTVAVKSEAGLAFTQIGAGELHSCALGDGGTAFCWGWNHYGQLGDGSNTDHSSPSPVFGQTFAYLAVGNEHTCGLTSGGVAWCWGNNASGQLGDGTTTNHSAPTLVAGGYAFRTISAGTEHTCGLTISGEAYCWGRDGVIEYHTPAHVDNAPAFTELTTGDRFTCGLTSAGAAYCWGVNLGQLGDGTTDGKAFPTPVLGGLAFKQVSAGSYHTCGVTTGNSPFCWGWNLWGQLGDGSTTTRLEPTPVAGGFAFDKISGGGDVTCGTTTSGVAYCWGANDYGQLGDGTTAAHATPAPVIAWLIFRT